MAKKKDAVCPTCGTCPTCGAAKPVEIIRFVDRPYPVYQIPYYVPPVYPQPTWTWPVITCGGVGATTSLRDQTTGAFGSATSLGLSGLGNVAGALGPGAN